MADKQLWQVTPVANDVKNDDGVIIGGQTAGTRYAPLTLIANFVHNLWAAFINAITPIKTSFASGDKIVVVNGSTANAMEADTLLELTAQNALADNVAPEFVPNSTTTVAEHLYMYNGLLYRAKEDYVGVWDSEKFTRVELCEIALPQYPTQRGLTSLSQLVAEGIYQVSTEQMEAVDDSPYDGGSVVLIVVRPNPYAVVQLLYSATGFNAYKRYVRTDVYEVEPWISMTQLDATIQFPDRMPSNSLKRGDSVYKDGKLYTFIRNSNGAWDEDDVVESLILGFPYEVTNGTINPETGLNVSDGKFIRTGYITNQGKPFVYRVPDNCYIQYVLGYNDNPVPITSEAYDGVISGPNVVGTNFVYVDTASKYMRFVVSRNNDDETISLDDLPSMVDYTNSLTYLAKNLIKVNGRVFGTRTIQGGINVNDGLNTTDSYALRTNWCYTNMEHSVLGCVPSGFYVSAICYYSTQLGLSGFVRSESFEPSQIVLVKPYAPYARFVIKKVNGGTIAPTDIDVTKIRLNDYQAVIDAFSKIAGSATEGKKLVVTGDSIPHGQNVAGVSVVPYPNIVASALGMELTNYSIGGSTFAQTDDFGGTFNSYADFVAATKDTSKKYVVLTGNQTYQDYVYSEGAWVTTNEAFRTPLSSRYQYMRDDADIILVHACTNDFQYNWTDIGTMSDRTPYTFYGALHYTILGLLDKYLGKQIIFCTPIKRCQSPYTTIESVNDKGKTLKEYGEIIKEVCDYYSIPVIDLWAESGLNPQVASQASLFDSVKTHPLQTGHNMLARVVSGGISKYHG